MIAINYHLLILIYWKHQRRDTFKNDKSNHSPYLKQRNKESYLSLRSWFEWIYYILFNIFAIKHLISHWRNVLDYSFIYKIDSWCYQRRRHWNMLSLLKKRMWSLRYIVLVWRRWLQKNWEILKLKKHISCFIVDDMSYFVWYTCAFFNDTVHFSSHNREIVTQVW